MRSWPTSGRARAARPRCGPPRRPVGPSGRSPRPSRPRASGTGRSPRLAGRPGPPPTGTGGRVIGPALGVAAAIVLGLALLLPSLGRDADDATELAGDAAVPAAAPTASRVEVTDADYNFEDVRELAETGAAAAARSPPTVRRSRERRRAPRTRRSAASPTRSASSPACRPGSSRHASTASRPTSPSSRPDRAPARTRIGGTCSWPRGPTVGSSRRRASASPEGE